MARDTFNSHSQAIFHYLCPRHQAWIAADAIAAVSLWRDAMGKGKAAYQRGSIKRSRFFGAAFESVVVRMRQAHAARFDLNITHLADAGRLFGQALCDLREYEEAERV